MVNILQEWIYHQMHDAEMARLNAMSDDELKRLWDNLGDDSFCEGHDCADIHLALNLRGLGAYCAI